jgi:ABC-type glycerol-3-phosphate transport system permease component
MVRLRRDVGQLTIHAVLVVLAFFTLVPLLTLVLLSFKDPFQFNANPFALTLPLNFENYAAAWKFMRDPILHNVIVAAVAVSASLLMASVSAFVFARFEFPGRNVLFGILVLVLLIPTTVLLVPTYELIIQLKVQNTLWALILPYAAHLSLVLFVLRTFFQELPHEMFDAARVDGAGVLQQYWYIAIPLSLPILSAMAIFQVWFIWNDYAWPSLVANSNEARTAVTGVIYFNDFTFPAPGAGMAAAVIAAIPVVILFFFTMRYFVAGLTAGAVKE